MLKYHIVKYCGSNPIQYWGNGWKDNQTEAITGSWIEMDEICNKISPPYAMPVGTHFCILPIVVNPTIKDLLVNKLEMEIKKHRLLARQTDREYSEASYDGVVGGLELAIEIIKKNI